MKKILSVILFAALCLGASAQEIIWHNAEDLTILGKALPTTKAYTRIDTTVYKFDGKTTDIYANYSTGVAVVFETDSHVIKARWTTSSAAYGSNMNPILQKGLDLYIMKDGKWVFAGVGRPYTKKAPYNKHEGTIVTNMADGTKQCLLYLPLFDRVDELEIGLEEGASIKALDNPFHHNIIVHGSSVTHGASASRPGMSYVARLGRNTGLYCTNLGFSGRCKLQKEYASYLADLKDVDAFVFDTFANPTSAEITERFDAFVTVLRAAHPGVPMIFLQTERRESRNFNTAIDESESIKQKIAEEKVREWMKKDKDIYFISSEDFLGHDLNATADGSHPTDLGFTYMLQSITPKIKKILKKYGIK